MAVLTLVCAGALALPTTFTGTAVGSWDPTSVIPDAEAGPGWSWWNIANNDSPNGLATILWGRPALFEASSYLKFDGAGSDSDDMPPDWTSLNDPFLLGTLKFYNGVIRADSGIDGVDLDLLVTITTPAMGPLSTFTYDVGIENTRNPESDSILFLNHPLLPYGFSYGGSDYLFKVEGFSLDEGASFVDEIVVCERFCKTAGLYGRIIETGGGIPPVPDAGSTIMLVGMAMFGLEVLRRVVR
jgi:hypothetical protein